MAEKIVYPSMGGLEVQTLDWGQTEKLIPDIMVATAEAYVAEFSHNLEQVPASAIRHHLDPEDPERLELFTERTRSIHDRGGRIAALLGDEAQHEPPLLGYTKMGPAQLLTRDDEHGRFQDENGRYSYDGYYFNNIVVHPGAVQSQNFWGRRLGSTLFHAGLTLPIGFEMPDREPGPIAPASVVVLDALTISRRINAWYQRIGFEPNPTIPTDGAQFSTVEIPRMYYATPPGVLLRGVVEHLEKATPELRDFTVVQE